MGLIKGVQQSLLMSVCNSMLESMSCKRVAGIYWLTVKTGSEKWRYRLWFRMKNFLINREGQQWKSPEVVSSTSADIKVEVVRPPWETAQMTPMILRYFSTLRFYNALGLHR